ncbi:response regulator transcription factor [Fulvivirga sp. M361]|uniref:LytR/AlgR family response regulator transcription factor n=1 Tax=Fulvivirga sp. M361 TaxID=2594266 RepID=UPI00117992CC|nr:LytTR family DNA-binding domain-containing protein [Fulvivirga sp. M361]TRX57556.1 response regulator transcription factor [Fulvivirga sp. M361]
MKVLIIEDEKPAAKRLERLLLSYDDSIEVVAKLDSVKSVIDWFQTGKMLDLVFMDIQLADGLSFEVFDHVSITAPIIFTTAYDEYALKAFKVNSVAYLLKPVDDEDLSDAFAKLNTLKQAPETVNVTAVNSMDQIAAAMQMLTRQYKNRFVVKTGEHIRSIAVDEILFFFSREKATFCTLDQGKNYLLDYTLQQLIDMLDPTKFFQINRRFIISLRSVKDIISYSNSRLKIVLDHFSEQDVIVSRERVNEFKAWLDQ